MEIESGYGLPSSSIRSVEDPDHPWWGIPTAVGLWLFSVAALVFMPLVAVFILIIVEMAGGNRINFGDQAEMAAWIENPRVILFTILATMVAHLLTLAACWAVVTRWKKQPLLESLGWTWNGPGSLWKATFVVVVVAGTLAVAYLLDRVLPGSKETTFDKLLKTSFQVRIAVACLAVFTAPLVEEWIYRGILYSALRKSIGIGPSVLIVTLLFAGVHFVQYWGNWATLAGVTLLSLILTSIRAQTKSIMPCVAIHFVNNLVVASAILISHGSK